LIGQWRPAGLYCRLRAYDKTNAEVSVKTLNDCTEPPLDFFNYLSCGLDLAPESRSGLMLAVLALNLLASDPAEAALLQNVPEWVQTAFGFMYLTFFGIFVLRLFKKRAKFATSTKLATKKSEEKMLKEFEDRKKPPTALDSFSGAAVAFVISYIFYQGSVKIDAGFAKQAVSEKYSIAQITITIRTIVSGLAYLATFVFGANATGLLLLGTQAALKGLFGMKDQVIEEEIEFEETVDDGEPTTVEAYLAQKKRKEEAAARKELERTTVDAFLAAQKKQLAQERRDAESN